MSMAPPEPITRFTVESLRVEVYEDRPQAGRAAAAAGASAIGSRLDAAGRSAPHARTPRFQHMIYSPLAQPRSCTKLGTFWRSSPSPSEVQDLSRRRQGL